MLQKYRSNWHVIFLFSLFAIICITNVKYRHYLTGWDNLQVELGYFINVKRNIFAAWQEYQGLGLPAGHAHAVESLRLLLFYPLYLFLPQWLFRYSFHLLMLLIGTISVFYLARDHILKYDDKKTPAFIGALFYMLSWGTVQIFYASLEPFSAFYAFLPLTLYTIFSYIKKGGQKNFLLVIFSMILLGFSFQIQTFFVVFGLLVCVPLFFYAISLLIRKNYKACKRVSIVLVTYILVNLYWLGNAIYYLKLHEDVRFTSMNNRIGSTVSFLQNVEYGNFKDVLLLRGFWYGNIDYFTTKKVFDFMMSSWSNAAFNYESVIIGFVFGLLVIFGLLVSILKRRKAYFFVIWAFAISTFFLININGPSGVIYKILIDKSPTLGEIFRFPFTKWSQAAVLSYSLLISIGVGYLLNLNYLRKNLKLAKYAKPVVVSLFLILIVFYSHSIFKGQLFYDNIEQKIPDNYFQLFSYMKEQPKSKRIATLPGNSFWGWYFNDWGYRGSGFIWYGIEQPILSRTFDVWNLKNEQFYYEFQYALYSENADLLRNVLEKYQVDYILLDESVILPNAERALFFQPTKDLFKEIREISLDKQWGGLSLYAYKQPYVIQDYIYTPERYFLNGDYQFSNLDNSLYTGTTAEYIYEKSNSGNFVSLSDDKDLAKTISQKNVQLNPLLSDETYELNLQNLEEKSPVPTRLSYDSTTHVLSSDYLYPQIIDSTGSVVWKGDSNISHSLKTTSDSELLLDGHILSGGEVSTQLLDKNSNLISFAEETSSQIDFSEKIYSAEVSDCLGGFGFYGKEFDKYPGSVKLRADDKNVCLDFYQKINIGKPQVLKVTFDHKSTIGGIPLYCLKSNLTKDCVNSKYKNSPLSSVQGDKYVDYVYVDKPQELSFSLILETDNKEDEQSATFKNITVDSYDVLEVVDVSPPREAYEIAEKITINPNQFPLKVELPDYGPIDKKYLAGDPYYNDEARNCDNFNEKEFDRKLIDSVDISGNPQKAYKYRALDAISCDSVDTRNINANASYLVTFDSENTLGKGLDICLAGESLDKCLIQDRLNGGQESFILPSYPAAESVSINLGNQSIGRVPTENVLKSINVQYIPYTWLKGIYLKPANSPDSYENGVDLSNVNKKAIYKYEVDVKANSGQNSGLIILNQSFEDGWGLYDKNSCLLGLSTPFTCKKATSDHVLAKNWANGWVVPSKDGSYVIIFWPQYLQFGGYLVLFALIVLVSHRYLKHHKNSPKQSVDMEPYRL